MEELAIHPPEFVGRDLELSCLKESLANAIEGRGSTVFISGEAGIGKTRLVDAFRGSTTTEDVKILAGAASEDSVNPFLMFSTALSDVIDGSLFKEQELNRFVNVFLINEAGLLVAQASSKDEDMDADIFAGMLSAVQDFVRDSFDSTGQESAGLGRLEYGNMKILIEHGQQLFLTAVLMGTEHPDMKAAMRRTLQIIEEKNNAILENWGGKTSEMVPVQEEIGRLAEAGFLVRRELEGVKLENERLRIADDVFELLKDLSIETPLAIFLDDLQWADESSLFVLNYLARNIREYPILMLGTFRPEESDILRKIIKNMKNDEILDEIVLKRLDINNTKSLIENTLSPNDFPDTLAERLYEQSKGNALFIIEILRGMYDHGSIAKQDGKYILASESYQVPATVEEVVNRRLETLEPDTIAMVEYASCIGKSFEVSLATGNTLVKDADEAIGQLVSSGILVRMNSTLEFSHAVFQTVIYNSIGDRWISNHHKNIGENLETAYQDNSDEVIYDLARHFSRTKEYQKCTDYCIRAGEKAEGSFAVEQALAFYEDALAGLSKLNTSHASDRALETLERTGDLQTLMGNYDEAIDTYMTVQAKANNNEDKARMLRKGGDINIKKGEYPASLKMLAEAKAYIQDKDNAELGRILLCTGIQYRHTGDYDKALANYQEAMKIFERSNNVQKDMGNAFRAIGNIYRGKGDYDSAINYHERSLAELESIDDFNGMGTTHINIGIVHWCRNNMDKSLEFFQRGLELCEKTGDKQGIAGALVNIGNVHWQRNEVSKALEYYELSLANLEKIGDKNNVAIALNNIGNVHMEMGQLDKALEFYRQSLVIREKIGEKPMISNSFENIGLAHYEGGNLDAAQKYFEQDLEIMEDLDNKNGISFALSNLGNVYRLRGELNKAQAYYERSLTISLETENKNEQIYNNYGLAEIYIELGNTQKALGLIEKSLALSIEMRYNSEKRVGRRILGMIYREEKDWDRALIEFEKAMDIPKEIGDNREIARLSYELGLLFKAKGEQARARQQLEQALSEFQSRGMKLWEGKCEKTLAEFNK